MLGDAGDNLALAVSRINLKLQQLVGVGCFSALITRATTNSSLANSLMSIRLSCPPSAAGFAAFDASA